MTRVALLVVLWLAVLVPQAVKSHNERRQEFLDSFQRGLGTLGATRAERSSPLTPQTAAATRRPRSPAQRRRTVLGLLLASIVVSAVPAVVMGGKAALAVHLAVDNVFLLYVGLLVRWRDARAWSRRAVPLAAAAGPAWDGEDDEALVVAAPRVRAAFR